MKIRGDTWGAILSDADIQWQLNHGGLVIEPYPTAQAFQPVSVDLCLGDQIIIPRGGRIIDPHKGLGVDDTPRPFTIFDLIPGEFVNVSTLERVVVPRHLVAFLAGKSTLARLGLQVEAAGLVDPCWDGQLTLELINLGPDTIRLRAGMKICQIYFLAIFDRAVQRPYGHPGLQSHYQGATGPETGRLERTAPEPDSPH